MWFFIVALAALFYFILETVYRDHLKKEPLKSAGYPDETDIADLALDLKEPELQTLRERVAKNFACPLCDHRRSNTAVVSVQGTGDPRKKPHKFLNVTCTTCGYTHFYYLNRLWEQNDLDPLPASEPMGQRFLNEVKTFQCRSCKAREVLAKLLHLHKHGLHHLLNPHPTELVSLICKACGWSSFFSASAPAKARRTMRTLAFRHHIAQNLVCPHCRTSSSTTEHATLAGEWRKALSEFSIFDMILSKCKSCNQLQFFNKYFLPQTTELRINNGHIG